MISVPVRGMCVWFFHWAQSLWGQLHRVAAHGSPGSGGGLARVGLPRPVQSGASAAARLASRCTHSAVTAC